MINQFAGRWRRPCREVVILSAKLARLPTALDAVEAERNGSGLNSLRQIKRRQPDAVLI
jgi:hypothetical protein